LVRKVAERYGIVVALVIEFVVFAIIADSFLTVGNFVNAVNQAAVIGIIAVGMTFVIIVGGIDLSVGSLVAFVGVIVGGLMQTNLAPPLPMYAVSVLVGLAAGAGVGAFSGFMITRFRIAPFIVTLALMSSLRGAAFIICKGRPFGGQPEVFKAIGRGHILRVPVPVLIMLATFAIGMVVLRKTRFGTYVYAIGGNEEAARLSGVDVRRVKMRVFMIIGTLSALSGVVLASRLGAGDPKAAEMYELDVIASTVVGGTSLMGGVGKIWGTFVGVMIIQVLRNGLNLCHVSDYWQRVAIGGVILGAVLLDQLKKRT